MEVEEPSPVSEFRFEESSPGEELSSRQPASAAELSRQTIVTTSGSQNVPVVTSSSANFSLAAMGGQKLELIGEEFVSKLKSEPEGGEEQGAAVVMSLSGAETATVMSSGTSQGDLVYCNLNDLDLSGSNETYSLSSLHSLAEASSTVQQQQQEKYNNAVSTILLQGGILQLKGEGGAGGLVTGHQVGQVGPDNQVLMTVGANQDKMVHSQHVPVSGSQTHARAQDAIASILASMNSQTIETSPVSAAANPVDYSTGVQEVDEVVALDARQFEERQEVLPLNLVTTSPTQGTVIQSSPGGVQLQGIKRNIQQNNTGGFVTKKVIIATINGTQRILTPVSSPQVIAMKTSSSRMAAEGSVYGGSSPIIIQKPVTQINKARQLNSPVLHSRATTDNKTCLWKFENGQICGKVFTKTYNLTVHMRMHQDIRPFPCTICEQTFRQKAHLQRHEATHGIDSTANRKRRKRPLMDDLNELSKRSGTESEEELYRTFAEKRKFADGRMKSEDEDDIDVDPMIEPIVGRQIEKKMQCPVNVGTNTEVSRSDDITDEIEESTLEPVKYRPNQVSKGVEQGVQYSEEDLLMPDSSYQEYERSDGQLENIDSKTIIRYVEPSKSVLKTEAGEEAVDEEQVYASQEYVTSQEVAADDQMISQGSDGQYIDTSSNQLVMSHEGELVGFVPVEGDSSQVVNISTTVNEHGQQVVIIENLHHHSPELQREIMNALISENNLVPMSQS